MSTPYTHGVRRPPVPPEPKAADTGGPAFPSIAEYIPNLGFRALDGMTLRDYFAAKSLQGSVASGMRMDHEERAQFAYDMADAMLEARK